MCINAYSILHDLQKKYTGMEISSNSQDETILTDQLQYVTEINDYRLWRECYFHFRNVYLNDIFVYIKKSIKKSEW